MTAAPGGAQLNPAQVEVEIHRLSALLETRTADLSAAAQVAAEAEAAYKLAEAREIVALIHGPKTTADERKARATAAVEQQLVAHLTAAATADSTKEACRSLRAQLSALQTISANHRGLT